MKGKQEDQDSSFTKARVFCLLYVACSVRTLEYNRFATDVFCMCSKPIVQLQLGEGPKLSAPSILTVPGPRN